MTQSKPVFRNRADYETADGGSQWLLIALVLSCVALFFQLFPGVWWGLLSYLDVRAWTWRSYAVLFGLAIGYLIYMKNAIES